MKHLLRYTLFLLTALLPVLAMADEKVKLNKYVTENNDGTYTLDLETYATGYTKQTESYVATDFVLVLDRSGSMSSNKLRGNRVAKNTTLKTSKTYQVVQDGRTYNLAYVNSSGGTSGTCRWRMCMNGTTPVSTFGETGDHTVTDSEEIYETQDVTRLDALKTAVSDFVQLVYDNNPTTGTLKHAVSIVWYGGDASGTGSVSDYAGNVTDGTTDFTSIAYDFIELETPTIATTIKNSVTAVTTSSPNVGSGTFCNYGLQVAYNTLLAAKDDKRNKVTVFFTDGEPGAYAGYFHEETARDACKYAVDLKSSALENTAEGESFSSDGITHNKKTFAPVVYSIGIMDSNTAFYHASSSYSHKGLSQAGDKYRFMHYVSSNYNLAKTDFPDTYTFAADISSAECQGEGKAASHHGSEDPHGYFMRSDGSDLSSAFAKIATKEIKDRDDRLGATSTVVLDVVTKQFKLPKNVKKSDITLYTCDAVETHTGTTVKWDATSGTGKTEVHKDGTGKKIATGGTTEYWTKIDATTAAGMIDVDEDTREVEVTNYDFKEHFVGPVRDFTDDDDHNIIRWTGQKLIIEFNIERDPANPGGPNLATNEGKSGIYLDGSSTPLEKFIVPRLDIPTIIITKKGLAVGESAVFEVERVTSSAGTTPDATNKFKNTYILTNTGSGDPTVSFVTSGPGYYKVTEKTWTWNDVVTYDKNNDGTPEENGTSYVQELTTTNLEKTFTFGVGSSPKTGVLPRYQSEKNKNNDFSTTTP